MIESLASCLALIVGFMAESRSGNSDVKRSYLLRSRVGSTKHQKDLTCFRVIERLGWELRSSEAARPYLFSCHHGTFGKSVPHDQY